MMELVEILARELKEWPEDIAFIAQDSDKWVGSYATKPVFDGRNWQGGDYIGQACDGDLKTRLYSDHATAIVTRADWEAERSRIAKTAKKPNKDGWIRHRGGKCPVDAGVLVEVRLRDGQIYKGDESRPGESWDWSNDGVGGDIMAYRIHKRAEQPVIDLPQGYGEVITATLESADGPLQWRDRITEIDFTLAALQAERESLIQRLAGEGLALIERAVQPVEDMSDPKNWKVGDVFVQVAGGSWNHSDGTLWTMTNDDGTDMRNYRSDSGSDKYVKDFALKFHSRPSA